MDQINFCKSSPGIILVLILLILAACGTNKEKSQDQSIDYYSMADFGSVSKIDIHAHISSSGKTLIQEARENNFRLLVMAVDVSEFPPMEEQLEICIKHRKEDPDVFAFATAFTLDGWDDPDWSQKVISQLAKDFDNGAQGVKVWKNIGMKERDSGGKLITLDDPKFDPVFEYIRDQNKVLLSHAGEPKNCWLPVADMTVNNDRNYFSEHPEFHMYLHPNMPSHQDHIDARNRMLDKNGEINFVGVHLASLEWSVSELAQFLDRYPNATVDLAERIGHLQHQSTNEYETVRKFMIKYQDRIIYGTDFNQSETTDLEKLKLRMKQRWEAEWKYFNTDETIKVPELDHEFKGLRLPKAVVDKIYRLNAEKILPATWG